MNWLEVSLIVDGEMAEAVAEVLARFAPGGVAIESTGIEDSLENEGRPTGPLRVCAYLPIDADIQQTRQRLEESLWYLGRIRPLPEPVFTPIQQVNWAENWKKHFQPIPVGKRLIIVPTWLDSPDQSRIPIRLDPGMAFGTGTHPTTQLCLELLEDYLQPGDEVLDIGCGSGILSIAAIKLGARKATGVDTDADAIAVACENASANSVAGRVTFAIGSIEEVKSGLIGPRKAPLVLVNILAHIISRLLDEGLGELIAPGGVMVLSGILEEQYPETHQKILDHGLRVIDKRGIEDWIAVAVQR